MSEPQKNSKMAILASVVLLVALIGYPLSIGPACWISSRTERGATAVGRIYQPIMYLCFWGDFPGKTLTGDLLHDYARSLASTRKPWYIRLNVATQKYEWSDRR